MQGQPPVARRRRSSRAVLLGVVALVLSAASPAAAVRPPTREEEGTGQAVAASLAPDRTVTVTPTAPATWPGAVASGNNGNFDPGAAGPCDKTPANYCDITLVNVDPGDFYSRLAGGVEFSTGGAAPGTDLDLFVYSSDASGNLGHLVGASAGPTDQERVSVIGASGYYAVIAVYFNATTTGYDGRAEFFSRNTTPADIDNPAGSQDVLVSDPSLGYRSHSEPHLSQDPTNPDIMVGGSKQYNLDPRSLAEYQFKIGTYASFDRGRSWADLGQLNVCPADQAPPSSWPLDNRCYPADDPNVAGDYGGAYTTSDVWTDFDDEGNAYAMVLDSPPFATGNGWGMSFHRWESPSAQDIASGHTWSRRIPINAYTTPETQAAFLDDKNSFAVNNAGPDHDGKTGIIVACWGQNFDLLNIGRQQIACERSTDAGRSWPDDPKPISPPQEPELPFGPFVIGVHVVASQTDPKTFYAVWLDTLTGFLDGSGLSPVWFAKTTDGAKTWKPAQIVARINQLPNIFPRQSFRNLSLPIMAAGKRGELYLTYAEYGPAPDPATDEDGAQADIKIQRSLDGGRTWSIPRTVNQDGTNADQFQPYVRITPRGVVNVSYFDRRLDRPDPPNHPGNFFIDTFLSRSTDGGRTFTDTRISHDSWDPSINPPISGSGEFIGDYQGLAADNCWTYPFVNDTHLANDPARDPDFDQGLPRSEFQQIVTWRVPNTTEYGGNRPSLDGCRGAEQGTATPYADLGPNDGTATATAARLSRKAVRRAHRTSVRRAAAARRVSLP